MTPVLRTPPRVHPSWTTKWWSGERAITQVFGPAPTLEALLDRIEGLPRPSSSWTNLLRGDPVPDDAVLVLAGQQPVLAGGPLLVAHKIATAIDLARRLQDRSKRPVVPVFLLATQDHDSDEIDHLDLISPLKGSLLRVRCPVSPRHEMFARSTWDGTALLEVDETLRRISPHLMLLWSDDPLGVPVAEPSERLVLEAFGPLGLRVVDAAEVGLQATAILEQALLRPEDLRSDLAQGDRSLTDLGLQPAFDPGDTRPLVLESRGGRRRRLEPGDEQALARMRARPADFSPHAALRPIVQAAVLPVVAQVVGPSEMLYLGQARRLHTTLGVPAPILVPRLEATLIPARDIQNAGTVERALTAANELLDPERAHDATPWLAALDALEQAAESFVAEVTTADPGLLRRGRRLRALLSKRARSLAEAPSFRSVLGGGALERLRPRGRPQDAVLSWAVEAWRQGDPVGWARYVVSLCRSTSPPEHVLHTGPPRSDEPTATSTSPAPS